MQQLTLKDKNLIAAFRISCNDERIKETVKYIHDGTFYAIHRLAFLTREATEEDKDQMKVNELYPYLDGKPIKTVKDITKCDPLKCLTHDYVKIPNIKTLADQELLFTKASTGGKAEPYMYILKTCDGYKKAVKGLDISKSSLNLLPMRIYRFWKETLNGNYDDCVHELHVFLPLNAPIVIIRGDAVRLHLIMNAGMPDIVQPPIQVGDNFYKLDSWKEDKETSSLSTYQYFKRLKGKDMNLPKLASPLKNVNTEAEAPAAPEQAVETTGAESVKPAAPVRALPKRKTVAAPAPKAVPAPEPAGTPEDSVTVEELQQRQVKEPQVESFDQPINAMEQPMDEQLPPPPAEITIPEPEAAKEPEKKRTRKAAPVVPVGFDFAPVIEYTGSALPEDLTADQIEAEIRALRDLVINSGRRMCNLTFAMRKTGAASEAKLKALADLIGK